MSADVFSTLAAVIVGSILTNSKDWLTYYYTRRSQGGYEAVRIIAILGEYAEKCASVVGDDGTCEGRPAGRTEHGEEYFDPQVTPPNPPTFPDDVNWRSIKFKLMWSILSLPNTARKTDRYINASAEYSFPPDYRELFSARQEGYARLGLEALRLIKEFQEEFRLPSSSPKFLDGDWNIETFLQDKLEHVVNRGKLP